MKQFTPATLTEPAQTRPATRHTATAAGSVLGPSPPRKLNPSGTLSVEYLARSGGAGTEAQERLDPSRSAGTSRCHLDSLAFQSSSALRGRWDVCWRSQCRCGIRLPPHSRFLLYLNAALSNHTRARVCAHARKSLKGRPPGSCAWDRPLKRHGSETVS